MKNVNNGFVQTAGFSCGKPIGAAPRAQPRMPERFVRVDVAQPGDARLVHEQELQRPPGFPQERLQRFRGEFPRESVHTEAAQGGRVFCPREPLHTAQMAPVHETQRARGEVESHIHVPCGLAGIKPRELPIQPKMQQQASVSEMQEKIFAASLDLFNTLACDVSDKRGWLLRPRGNRVDDAAA